MKQVETKKPEPIELTEIPVACPCSFRDYPHILHNAMDVDRHRRGESK